MIKLEQLLRLKCKESFVVIDGLVDCKLLLEWAGLAVVCLLQDLQPSIIHVKLFLDAINHGLLRS